MLKHLRQSSRQFSLYWAGMVVLLVLTELTQTCVGQLTQCEVKIRISWLCSLCLSCPVRLGKVHPSQDDDSGPKGEEA